MNRHQKMIIVIMISIIITLSYFISFQSFKPATASNYWDRIIEETTNSLPEVYPFAPRVSAEDYIANNQRFSVDENGILITDYGELYNKLGKWYNPLFIASYANALYADFLKTKDTNKAQQFLCQADWLLQSAVQRDDMVVWEYPFPNEVFGMETGWISGFTQAIVLNILTRAHALTGDSRYLDIASKVLRSFEVTTSDGGVSTRTSMKGAFYEEYAQEGATSNKVLNGHIGALVGLWDYYLHTRDDRAFTAFFRGVDALRETLNYFDACGMSYYSLNPLRLAGPGGYNRQHVAQLLWLYNVTEDPLFLVYALKFNAYELPNYKVIAVKGATNPETHGMENLYLGYGQKGYTYWSHSKFPTWVEIDLGRPKAVTGFTLFSGLSKRTWPKDYDIALLLNNQWITIVKERNSSRQIMHHIIPSFTTRRIKVTIFNDNGNNNVVLRGFGIEATPESKDTMAIVDWNNYIIAKNPSVMVDRDSASSWTSRDRHGWIILDLNKDEYLSSITLHFGTPSRLKNLEDTFSILISRDARKWFEVASVSDNKQCVLEVDLENHTTRYVKIEFNCSERTTISEIVVNKR
jgi:hypothetical protein